MASEFQLFGTQHLTVLALTCVLSLVLIFLVRWRRQAALCSVVLWGIAAVLILNRLWAVQIAWDSGLRDWVYFLPLHLCDVATFLVVAACITRHVELIRITYFFALAGTLQAILTPDIREGFPAPRFLTFFISHCGIVVGALVLTVGCRVPPTWGALLRAFLWLQLYAVVVILVNALLDTNYGYLARKPINPSILDYFGPWPWYILVLEGVALVKFTLVMLPFALAARLHRTREEKVPSI